MKFFTKSRRKILVENRFSKYLIYAIGEILLVVVGILIAIRINDWNRESILLEEEKEAYELIITDLKRDSVLFDFYAQRCKGYLDAYFHLNDMKRGSGYFKDTNPDLIVSNIEFNPVVQKNNLPIIDKLKNEVVRNQINSYFRRLDQLQQATQGIQCLDLTEKSPLFLRRE